ncbi:MAG: FtsW/RodA/SpoVE family cell cycle protein [Ectobacillus sp.]
MKKVWKSLDYSLVLPLIILSTIGIIMVYSASSIVAITKYKQLGYESNHFFLSQLRAMGLGLLALVITFRIPYVFLKKRFAAIMIYGGTLALLTAVLLFGKTVNNAQSWIFGIQPAEFTKLGVIIVTARFLAKKYETNTSFLRGIGGIASYLLAVFWLIYKQPDLGTDLLIVGIVAAMAFCSGVRIKIIIKRVLLTSVIWLPLLIVIGMVKLTEEQISRFTAFMNPFADPQGDGFHLINSFIAIASGGIGGAGLGNSIQKSGYLPEPHTDFIMAIVSEELGLLGVAIILASLILIILRAFRMAQKCRDPFLSFLCIGIGSMLAIQSIANVGGITGLLPLTGVPLPFVSFGGSSLLMNFASMGLLLNVSARIKEQQQQRVAPSKPHLVVVK